MSLTNEQITAQNFKDFYGQIRPYLNGSFPTPIVNQFSKADMYSTDEKIVGSFVDGKPLYQKTFAKTMPTFSSGEGVLKITEAVSNDYDVMVEMSGIIQIGQNDYANIGGFSNNTTEDRMWFGDFSGTICLGVISSITNRSGKPVYITLRYTKTGDTPIKVGTGNDYSTDEQIVGSWIDGKPVYQKTITGRTSSSDDITTISNVFDGTNVPISITGIIYTYNSSNYFMPRPMYYYSSGDHFWAHMNSTINGFSVFNSGNRNRDFVLTVQYTKTTD